MKLAIFILATFFIQAAFAQKITSQLSDDADINLKDYSGQKASLGNNIFLYHCNGYRQDGSKKAEGTVTILKYNTATKASQSSILSIGGKDFGIAAARLIDINDHLCLIYNTVDRKHLENIMVTEVDTNTLATAPPKKIAEAENAGYQLDISGEEGWDYFCFASKSPDGKKAALVIISNDGKCFISVLNESLDAQWSNQSTLMQGGYSKVSSCAVDNFGNVYIAYQLFQDKFYRDKQGPIMGRSYVYIGHPKGVPTSIVTPVNGMVAAKLLLSPARDGKSVHAVSFYYDAEPLCLKGAFCFSIGTGDFKPFNIITSHIPDDIINQFVKENFGNKDARGIGVYGQMLHCAIVEMSDGSVDIAEAPYTIATSSNMSSSGLSKWQTSSDITGSVLNAYFSSGNAVFACVPRKAKTIQYSTGNNFALSRFNNLPVILYNDNLKSLDKDTSEQPEEVKGHSNLALLAATINKDGNLNRQVCVDLSSESYIADPVNSVMLDDDTIVIPFVQLNMFVKVKKGARFAAASLQ